jgi:hypothetical protein
MAASRNDIKRWFEQGKKNGASHMIVACDTFDHEDYPVYVKPGDNPKKEVTKIEASPMQRVMEVYRLSDDMEKQLQAPRAYNI